MQEVVYRHKPVISPHRKKKQEKYVQRQLGYMVNIKLDWHTCYDSSQKKEQILRVLVCVYTTVCFFFQVDDRTLVERTLPFHAFGVHSIANHRICILGVDKSWVLSKRVSCNSSMFFFFPQKDYIQVIKNQVLKKK